MSFFASVKKLFTKTKRRKESEKGIEMTGNIKPVYTRKIVGVSPKRQHRIMNSPPLRKKTTRRGRHHLDTLTPIESMTTPSSTPQFISMSRSKSRSPLPPLQIPKSSSYNSSNSNTRRKRQRGQRRYRHPNYAKHKIYRARLKTSTCRKIKPGAKCKLRIQCKYAMGNIRQFCRKRKNTHVRHYMG